MCVPQLVYLLVSLENLKTMCYFGRRKSFVNYYLAHHNKLYQHRTTQHVLPVKKKCRPNFQLPQKQVLLYSLVLFNLSDKTYFVCLLLTKKFIYLVYQLQVRLCHKTVEQDIFNATVQSLHQQGFDYLLLKMSKGTKVYFIITFTYYLCTVTIAEEC